MVQNRPADLPTVEHLLVVAEFSLTHPGANGGNIRAVQPCWEALRLHSRLGAAKGIHWPRPYAESRCPCAVPLG